MKILIVSGFLGAGKTTFIQTMAKAAGRQFVVYENEYAGAGIDTARLEEDGLNVWESTENCVCCSGKADFASALLTISGSLNPEYLVVEPTGAAKLSSILENVRQMLYGTMQLLKPVVIADAVNFTRSRMRMPELFEDQLRAASFVVLSKTEQVLPEETKRLKAEIRKLNTDAVITDVPFPELTGEWFQQLLQEPAGAEALPAAGSTADSGEQPEQLTLRGVYMDSPEELLALMYRLTAGGCGQVLRAKGNLLCGKEGFRFDFVDGQWAITGAEEAPGGECVFIGQDLQRELLQDSFHSLLIPKGLMGRQVRPKSPEGEAAYRFRPRRATEQ